MAALPAYSLVLGLIALLGYMAIAAGVTPIATDGKPDPNTVVPLLFDQMFPDWFAGVAFAAIGIGALVPAAIMSIAAANLFTRNVYKEYLNQDATPAQEARMSKLASLVVKAGARGRDPGARPAVLDRPAADRRRDHPADAAADRASASTPGGSTAGPCSPAGPSASRRACTCSTTRRTRPPARRTSAARRTRCRTSASTRKVTIYTGFVALVAEPARGRRRHADAAQLAGQPPDQTVAARLPGRGGRSGRGAAAPTVAEEDALTR